jgi:hypothetical protein
LFWAASRARSRWMTKEGQGAVGRAAAPLGPGAQAIGSELLMSMAEMTRASSPFLEAAA